jgi:predicted RNA binding protein YcfA (HicA-like mRNA interferase family)
VKLPRVSGKQALEALLKIGFFVHRVHGSHYILKHQDTGFRITIPYHRKTLAPKTLNTILKQAGISPDEFSELL